MLVLGPVSRGSGLFPVVENILLGFRNQMHGLWPPEDWRCVRTMDNDI